MSDAWFGAVTALAVALVPVVVVVKVTEFSAYREGRTDMFTATCAAKCGAREKTVVDTANDDWKKWTCACAAESAVPLK